MVKIRLLEQEGLKLFKTFLGSNYLNHFLLTYRTFLSSMELIDLLKMRYHIPPPVNATEEVMQRFRDKLEQPIQLRYEIAKFYQ